MSTSSGSLQGTLERRVWSRPDESWAIFRLEDADGRIHTVVGNLAGLGVGDRVRCQGKWIEDPRYGRQLQVEGILPLEPDTVVGIRKYLEGRAIPGIGPKLAQRIVDAFGIDTLAVLDTQPKRLAKVPGIGRKKAKAICDAVAKKRGARELIVYLRSHDISPSLSHRIHESYGDKALLVVRQTPYRLIEDLSGVGFLTADRLARSQGLARDSAERIRAGLRHSLQEAAGQGHAALPKELLRSRAATILELPEEDVEAPLEHCLRAGILGSDQWEDAVLCYLPELRLAEQRVVDSIARLQAAPLVPMTRNPEASLDWAAKELGCHWSEDQHGALSTGLESPLYILTGGPGTGKTTCLSALVAIANRRGFTLRLAAPTGRAARRLSDATGQQASTLHRLLEFQPGRNAFLRGKSLPLKADLIIIDEASMLDLSLAADLLEAVPTGCRVWFVGDADQLPSVGPGQILRDLIDSGAIPTGALRHIHRQAHTSAIVEAAHDVLQGQFPSSGQDFFVIPREDPEAIVNTLLELTGKRIPGAFGLDPITQIQVLSPVRRGLLGTIALNETLRQALNPEAADKPELRAGARLFRTGDRVLQIANDYDLELFNGDPGRVLSVDPEGPALLVDFDGKRVKLSGAALDRIEPAFALTVHKSQGSEYPAVVLVLHGQHYIMLRRNLLYTALTRGKELVVIVGSAKAVAQAARQSQGGERYTGLVQRLLARP